jgi:hypothetical protein
MPYSFQLLKLLRSEMELLEKLRCLEMKSRRTIADNNPEILQQIHATVEEIAQANRLVRDLKARHLQGIGSLAMT